MSAPMFVPREAEARLGWLELAEAIADGHRLPRARLSDSFLRREEDTLLVRSAWIDGLGIAVKTATVFPDNPSRGEERVQGGVLLHADATGRLEAVVDFQLVTKWKTAADSLLAARLLAPRRVERVLVVGGGAVGRSGLEAFGAGFPKACFGVWSRSHGTARAAAAHRRGTEVVEDLEAGVRAADIVVTCTLASQPVIRGAWVKPGAHVNLIGAFRAGMREADDELLRRGRIFVDSRETTIPHIGELADPIARGVITPEDVVADFYDIPAGRFRRRSEEEITVFKNGGGAHLDLMTARYILARWQSG